MDLTLSFKTTVEARVEGLASNVNYLENRLRNFIQKKCDRIRRLPRTRFVLWTVIFLFVRDFYTVDDS